MITIWILALASILTPARSEGPFQDLTVDQALAAAKRDKKVVMIDFFTTWCVPCKKLDKLTWSDPEVQKWLAEKTVPLKLDAEKEVDLAKRFEVSAYPTMVFVKADGTKFDQIVGFVKPEEFLSVAKDALVGKTSTVRTNEKLAQLKEKLVGHENDPMARQAYAEELEDATHYEEALTEYLWCFDNGKKAPGYVGVRLSFLLMYIARLGEKYPLALKALEDRRDAAESRLAAGSDSADDASEVVAINRELKVPEKSLATYDRMKAAKPLSSRIRVVFGREVLGPLVDAQRYQEALDLFDDPEGYVTWYIKTFQSTPRSEATEDKDMKEAMESANAFMKDRIVSDCSKMYEALVGASKKEVAGKVADDLITFAPSGRTYSTLIKAAVRAHSDEVARSLAARGAASLPDKEKSEVERAAKKIPTPK